MTKYGNSNVNLNMAKANKKDEFYTRYEDIEKEMLTYLEVNLDVFRDKIILCPCDDPEHSQFVKYFVDNFKALGLKKLIATGFKEGSNGVAAVVELDSHGEVLVTRSSLRGNGDFRSSEVTALRDEVDMVITNPPFSLFREFTAWLKEGGCGFSILGNLNAITYVEMFPLIQSNRVWLGSSISSGDRPFLVPNDYDLYASTTHLSEDGSRFIHVKGVRWFTTLDNKRRHELLTLNTAEYNLRCNSRLQKSLREAVFYKRYDNYDAIEVPFVSAIPLDYDGIMGVPITFLDKYNRDQFEILGCSYRHGQPEVWPTVKKMSPVIEGEGLYKRIFIRHKR